MIEFPDWVGSIFSICAGIAVLMMYYFFGKIDKRRGGEIGSGLAVLQWGTGVLFVIIILLGFWKK